MEAIVADRNRPQKHIDRAQVVLAAAERHPHKEFIRFLNQVDRAVPTGEWVS